MSTTATAHPPAPQPMSRPDRVDRAPPPCTSASAGSPPPPSSSAAATPGPDAGLSVATSWLPGPCGGEATKSAAAPWRRGTGRRRCSPRCRGRARGGPACIASVRRRRGGRGRGRRRWRRRSCGAP